MKPIEIARKLAEYKQTGDAQKAYFFVKTGFFQHILDTKSFDYPK